MEIVPIKKLKNEDAISMLKDVIKMVESGEITDLGISWALCDQSIGGDISEGENNLLMWASLEHLARSFYKEIIEE